MESKVYARLMETDALLEFAPRVGQRRIIVWRVLDGGQSRATVAAVVCAACSVRKGPGRERGRLIGSLRNSHLLPMFRLTGMSSAVGRMHFMCGGMNARTLSDHPSAVSPRPCKKIRVPPSGPAPPRSAFTTVGALVQASSALASGTGMQSASTARFRSSGFSKQSAWDSPAVTMIFLSSFTLFPSMCAAAASASIVKGREGPARVCAGWSVGP